MLTQNSRKGYNGLANERRGWNSKVELKSLHRPLNLHCYVLNVLNFEYNFLAKS